MKIVEKIQHLPDEVLPEVSASIDRLSVTKRPKRRKDGPGILQLLQEINIDGPTDFSRNFELYLNGEKKIGDNLP